MIENYVDVIKNRYAEFNGRANRKEFWLFWLVVIIVEAVFFILLNIIAKAAGFDVLYWGLSALLWTFLIAMFIPMLALIIRRLHDIGKAGTWFFISFVPFIGGIWLLILLLTDSQQETNQFD